MISIVRIATLFTEALSLIEANRELGRILYVADKTLIISRAISSPLRD